MQLRRTWLLTGLVLAGLAAGGRAEEEAGKTSPFPYPYGSEAFTSLVEESARTTGLPGMKAYTAWMENEVLPIARSFPAGRAGSDWPDMLERHRSALDQSKDPEERARKEMALGMWLHGVVKKALPNYNLERGFELSNAAGRGERQCLLQSIFITSLLQAMGVDAGIAMVHCNNQGQYTNNTHVVVVMKLSNGRDALLDASYDEHLVAHRGLMAMLDDGRYRYVRPDFTRDGRYVVSYSDRPTGETLETSQVRPMDMRFVRSQFDFYRGERTPGGALAKTTSAAGLQRSVRFFESSLEHCDRNPLSAYFLGLTFEKQGRMEDAARQYRLARDIYSQVGWIPNQVYRAVSRTGDVLRSTAANPDRSGRVTR